MAINVRYGPSGDLLNASVEAGKGEDFWRRFSAGQQLVQQTQAYYAQQDANNLKSQQLQMAYDLQRRQNSTPTPTSARMRTDEFAQEIQNAKLAGLTREQQANLDIAKEYGGIQTSGQLVQQYLEPFKNQTRTPIAQAKQAYATASLSDFDLTSDQAKALATLIADPSINLEDFRQQVTGIRDQKAARATQQRYETTIQARDIESQEKILQGQIDTITKELTDAGFNPATTPPSEFNPNIRTVGGNTSEFYRGVGDIFVPGQPLSQVSSGGSADMLQKYSALAQLQRKVEKLRQQRLGLISNRTIPSTTSEEIPTAQEGWSIQRLD